MSLTRHWRKRLAQTLDSDSQTTFFPPPPPASRPSGTLPTPATAREASSTEELPLDPELTIDQAEALRDIEAAFEPDGLYLLTLGSVFVDLPDIRRREETNLLKAKQMLCVAVTRPSKRLIVVGQ